MLRERPPMAERRAAGESGRVTTEADSADAGAADRASQDAGGPSTRPAEPPFTGTREFWVLIGYALVLGVLGAFIGLVFMGVIGVGNDWFSSSDFGWFA